MNWKQEGSSYAEFQKVYAKGDMVVAFHAEGERDSASVVRVRIYREKKDFEEVNIPDFRFTVFPDQIDFHRENFSIYWGDTYFLELLGEIQRVGAEYAASKVTNALLV